MTEYGLTEEEYLAAVSDEMHSWVYVTALRADEGTVCVFEGLRIGGERVAIAVDHRMAQAFVEMLEAGDHPLAIPEPWQYV